MGVATMPLVIDLLLQRSKPPGFSYWYFVLPSACLAIFYYLNSLVFIPRFLARRRVGRYF
jgi:hypothetical protein